jgi:hypothetical protein
MEEINLSPLNTRLIKLDNNNYQILVASAENRDA